MKLNISYPVTGCVKSFEVHEEKMLLPFYEKRIGAEVPADTIDESFAGYLLRVTGGNDKQGFPMMQGVLTNNRVRLLFRKGMPCFRERRAGSMKRKSVRGCIVASDISALNLTIIKKGAKDIQDLTTEVRPRRLGPKRANKIRKLFNLSKEDDVRKFVVRRVIKEGKKSKAPKIQRLITNERIQRKRRYKAELKRRGEKSKADAANFKLVLEKYLNEKKESAAAKSKKSGTKAKRSTAAKAAAKEKESTVAAQESTSAAKETPTA